MSPAGEALAMLPPSVPRFWIWAAPIVDAASTRAGRYSRQRAERRISVYVVSAPRITAVAIVREAAERVEPPEVEDAAGGSPSSPVIGTMTSVPPAIGVSWSSVVEAASSA